MPLALVLASTPLMVLRKNLKTLQTLHRFSQLLCGISESLNYDALLIWAMFWITLPRRVGVVMNMSST